MDKERKSERIMILAGVFLAVLCVIGITVGTFADLDAANAVHAPDSVLWRIFTVLGMYPFMALWVLYMGVICRQVRNSQMSEKKKTIWSVVCLYLGLSTSVICSWAMFAVDTIGGVFPQTIDNPPLIAAGALFGVYPLFFVGFFTSGKAYDKRLLKNLIILCVIMVIALYVMISFKFIFCRPRYRLLIQGIPGIEFHQWYERFSGSDVFVKEAGVDRNDFRSFPSGHALQSMGLIFALPPLADVYSLKGKKVLLYSVGAVFALLVSFSRMVMGAHFLSDVSMGSLISVLISFVVIFLTRSRKTDITDK